MNSALADSAAAEAGVKAMDDAVATAQATVDRSQSGSGADEAELRAC